MADVNGEHGQAVGTHAAGPKKKCKKCGAMIPQYTDTCPSCGANLKPVYKKAWFWILIIVVLLVLVIGGCVNSCGKALQENTNSISTDSGTSTSTSTTDTGTATTDTTTTTGDTTSDTASKYTVTDETIVDKGYGMYALTGTFTNTSGKELSYVGLEYVLTDESGAQIGTAYANTTNLGDQTAWKFEAYASISGDVAPAGFELKEVSGY